MLDFLLVASKSTKKDVLEIYPKFIVRKSEDLMVRGRDFYAIWDEETGLWSTDEDTVVRLIDKELDRVADEKRKTYEGTIKVLHMWDSDSGSIAKWHRYVGQHVRDNYKPLDENLIFSNTETSKTDYATKKLCYALRPGTHEAWDELVGTLYTPPERMKIEWIIGAIVSGDSKDIQKFGVFHGEGGTGKSTIINVIEELFGPYVCHFSARDLGSSNAAFALEPFRDGPLVAVEHDGDLSRIDDNSRLNSVISHEQMTINEKFKSSYTNRFRAFLIVGSNKPVKITDAKSGIIRRLIDISPSGKTLPRRRYKHVVSQVAFELGAIASHCLSVYKDDPSRYDTYIPSNMLAYTNDFYNFIIENFDVFKRDEGIGLDAAYEMYKTYCTDAKVSFPYGKRMFRYEFSNYWDEHYALYETKDKEKVRDYFVGFKSDKFLTKADEEVEEQLYSIEFKTQPSIFDKECAECPAQYAGRNEKPVKPWDDVLTTLFDLNTKRIHYVRVPVNHIVIDFDLKDENGEKSFELNLEAASKWPKTYAELSKSGAGIHLHYIYDGDPELLLNEYDKDIEIKVFTGKTSLRRKLTKCNNLPIAHIDSGLPTKGAKKVVDFKAVGSEMKLRELITRNMKKEFHPGTKPSVDFIFKILEDAYASDLKYDVTDMRPFVLNFAMHSSHQAGYCVELVNKMHFKSKEDPEGNTSYSDDILTFFDVEVFPNLFVIVYKRQGFDPVKLINPSKEAVGNLLKMKLVGFNCRRYDNHILYAAWQGYTNEELYELSRKIIEGKDRNAFFGSAYGLSYTDVYDFSSKKQSLKKFEIELGIHHQELGLKWDEPVPEDLWDLVADYCVNDVIATEKVFEARKGDFLAREILADLADMSVNDTTNSLTTRIIFGRERHPELVYTDLSKTFPGYEFVDGKNMYRGVNLGKGGYIISTPGVYENVAVLDVTSLHPHSIKAMNCFGEYTKNFVDLMDARVAIKHGDFDTARGMFNGKLSPYLEDEGNAGNLAQALKIAINSVYGLTAANFDNPFRDVRNKNNIVALRGALFMKTLQDDVETMGYKIVAIKTDSIKIADADTEIINFCMELALEYGYNFEHEATYSKICQINDADYIARLASSDWCKEKYGYIPGDNAKKGGKWSVTGKQFAIPYVFKTLFSHEPIDFKDLCVTSAANTALYLDMNEKKYLHHLNLIGIEPEKDECVDENCIRKYFKSLKFPKSDIDAIIADPDNHDYVFVGRVGSFVPVISGANGGLLMREKDGKYFAAAGSKGFRWLEEEQIKKLGLTDKIDMRYFREMATEMKNAISKYCDFEWFIGGEYE